MNPQIIQESKEQWKNLEPEAEFRSLHSQSSTYNCMGLVFASRRTWIDTEFLEMIMEDDGYDAVDEKSTMIGDLVLYCDQGGMLLHIGVVVEKLPDVTAARFKFRILSKWGSGGEYIHPLQTVPVTLGTPIGFITDRSVAR